jgi:hypothetical protein
MLRVSKLLVERQSIYGAGSKTGAEGTPDPLHGKHAKALHGAVPQPWNTPPLFEAR